MSNNNVIVQFVGFEAKAQVREYTFTASPQQCGSEAISPAPLAGVMTGQLHELRS
jgi:hypothetical protein